MARKFTIADSRLRDGEGDDYALGWLHRLPSNNDRRNKGNISPGWSGKQPAQPGELAAAQSRE